MPRKRALPAEVTVATMQQEMEALRVEMALLKKRESELAARIAERARGEEKAFERLLGQVLLRDLDPGPPGSHQGATDEAGRRALGHRCEYYATRIRDAIAALPSPSPRIVALLQRLDEQSCRGQNAQVIQIERDIAR